MPQRRRALWTSTAGVVIAVLFAGFLAMPDTSADGVYATRDRSSAFILELKRGHYRLWAVTDHAGTFDRWWPATGAFSLHDEQVILHGTDFPYAKRLRHIEHEGRRYLMLDESVSEWRATGRLTGGVPAVDRQPEQILDRSRH